MSLQESGEMYLETILVLSKSKGSVRAIDIANNMGFSKAAVSKALVKLKDENLIIVDDDLLIHLSEQGLKKANEVYEKHLLLTKYIMLLGVDEETAEKDACKIEHVISDSTFKAMVEHAKKYNN